MGTRRDFVRQLGGVAMAAAIPSGVSRAVEATEGMASRDAGMRLGYAAITWGGDDDRAIDDIAALGFPGIQLRANVVERWPDPSRLRDLLARHRLAFVALSSGNVSSEAVEAQRMIQLHVDHARYLRDAGGLYLQLIDERPRGRAVQPDDYERLGDVMNEIGRRARALGVTVAYHPHMGSMGETPEGSERVLAATDATYVKLLLDVAHYQAGGGNSVVAIHTYAWRIPLLHLKDLRHTSGGRPGDFDFVELGRGEVDLPSIFAALREERFDGWGIVELDSVPADGGTPKEAAVINKQYLAAQLGLAF